jgi:hypothetical protein
MKTARVLGAALLLVCAGNRTGASAQPSSVAGVLSCDEATLARPQYGTAYKGSVHNSDYRFTMRIPPQYTGWGAAPNAPFHGFAVFLGNAQAAQQSCIVFEIQHHVLLPEDNTAGRDLKPDLASKPHRIGNRNGFQRISTGSLSGVSFENVTLNLELPHEDYMNDLMIMFVTPLTDRARTEPIFRSLIASFRFW